MTKSLIEDLARDGASAPEAPAKFRDPATGEVRLDALLKSYADLERKLSRSVDLSEGIGDADAVSRIRKALGVPEAPDGYACKFSDPDLGRDPELDERLHAAGFTNDQAQVVYDLAAEYVLPALRDLSTKAEFDRQRARLLQHFGGEDTLREISRQLLTWGEKNLPKPVFEALTSTHEGVVALQHMMQSGEPGLMRGAAASETEGEEELDRQMRDPRYWRDRDPQLVAKVTEGFKRLYRS